MADNDSKKMIEQLRAQKRAEDLADFNRKQSILPVDMSNSTLSEPEVKIMPREKISTTEKVKIGNGEDFIRNTASPSSYDKVINYNDFKKPKLDRGEQTLDYAKMRQDTKNSKIPSNPQPEVLNYETLRKEFKSNPVSKERGIPGNSMSKVLDNRIAKQAIDGGESLAKKLGRGLKTFIPGAAIGASLMGSGNASAGEALAEELMPDIMVPTESGPTKDTEGYDLEHGRIPQELQLSAEELNARKKALEAMRGK
jgi:hypothetical protein